MGHRKVRCQVIYETRSAASQIQNNSQATAATNQPQSQPIQAKDSFTSQLLKTTSESNLCRLGLQNYKGEFYEYTEADGSKSLIYSGDKDHSAQLLRYGTDKWEELSETQKTALNLTQKRRAENALIKRLKLNRNQGRDAYTSSGFKGDFHLQTEPQYEMTGDFSGTLEDVINEKLSVFYEGGKNSKGEVFSSQTFHHGKWDEKRDKPISSQAERLMESVNSTVDKIASTLGQAVHEVGSKLGQAIGDAIKVEKEAVEIVEETIKKQQEELDSNFKNPPLILAGTSGKLPTLDLPIELKVPGSDEFVKIQNNFGQGFEGLRIRSDGSFDATNATRFGTYTLKVLGKEYSFNVEPKLPEKIKIKTGEDANLRIPSGVEISFKAHGGTVDVPIDKEVLFANGLTVSPGGKITGTQYKQGIHEIKTAGGQVVKVIVEDDLKLPERIEPGQKANLNFPKETNIYVLPPGAKDYRLLTEENGRFLNGATLNPNGEFEIPEKYAGGTYKFKTEGGQEANLIVEPTIKGNDVPKRILPGSEIKLPIPERAKFSIKGPGDKDFRDVDKELSLQKGFVKSDGSFKTIKSGKYTVKTEGGQEFSFVVEPTLQKQALPTIVNPGDELKLPIPKGVKFAIKGPGDEDFTPVDKRRNGTFKTSKVGKYTVKTEGGQEFEFAVEPKLVLPETIPTGTGKLDIPQALKFSIRMPGATKDVQVDKPFNGAGGIQINPDGTYDAPKNMIGYTIKFKTDGGQETDVMIMPKTNPQSIITRETDLMDAVNEFEKIKEAIIRNCTDEKIDNQTKKKLHEYLRDYSQAISERLRMELDPKCQDRCNVYKKEAQALDVLAKSFDI